MSTFAQMYCHVVFATKNRQPLIENSWKPKLHAYMAGICKNLGSEHNVVGGVADHVHLLVSLPRTVTIADFVKKLKRASTSRIRSEHGIAQFQWQEGYGAFAVSPSALAQVTAYIQHQEQHHTKMSFLDEYKAILDKVGIQYDAKYLP